jgi:hypothetical protein
VVVVRQFLNESARNTQVNNTVSNSNDARDPQGRMSILYIDDGITSPSTNEQDQLDGVGLIAPVLRGQEAVAAVEQRIEGENMRLAEANAGMLTPSNITLILLTALTRA